jgi:hypothetical protein
MFSSMPVLKYSQSMFLSEPNILKCVLVQSKQAVCDFLPLVYQILMNAEQECAKDVV